MLHYAPHRSELQMVPKGTKPGHLQVLTYPGNNTQIWCSRTQPNPTSNTPSISLSYWAFHWLHAYETSLVCKSKSVGNKNYICLFCEMVCSKKTTTHVLMPLQFIKESPLNASSGVPLVSCQVQHSPFSYVVTVGNNHSQMKHGTISIFKMWFIFLCFLLFQHSARLDLGHGPVGVWVREVIERSLWC